MKAANVSAYHAVKEARRKLNLAMMALDANGGDGTAQRDQAAQAVKDAVRILSDALQVLQTQPA